MAFGKVCTGFSRPYVAKYNNAGGAVTYTAGMRLARGVSVSISPEASDDNNFYADNMVSESENGRFTGGTLGLTVDGLLQEAERLIFGLPEPEEVSYGKSQKVSVQKYGDNAEPPYVGVGVIVEYQSEGVTTYTPVVLTKAKFKTSGTEAQTREDTKNWQTQDLEASLCRDDTADHAWKWVAAEQTTEEAAAAIIEGLFNVAKAESGGDPDATTEA